MGPMLVCSCDVSNCLRYNCGTVRVTDLLLWLSDFFVCHPLQHVLTDKNIKTCQYCSAIITNKRHSSLHLTEPLLDKRSWCNVWIRHWQCHWSALWREVGIWRRRQFGTLKHLLHRGKMIPAELERLVRESIEKGNRPYFVNCTCGTTVLGAFDPINPIADICEKYNLWLHIDVSDPSKPYVFNVFTQLI